MRDSAPSLALAFGLTLLGVSACGTQEIDPSNTVMGQGGPGPDVEQVAILFPPLDDTYAAYQARIAGPPSGTAYQVWMDGQLMMWDAGQPLAVSPGGITSVAYFPATPHHFRLAAPGAAPIFEGDAPDGIGNGTVTLFLYGTLDALHGTFVNTSDLSAPDMEHLMVFNLTRSQNIEMVKCTSTTDCEPYGDGPRGPGGYYVFDVPAFGFVGNSSSFGPDGAGYGYRLVPTANVPNPTVLPLHGSIGAPTSFLGAAVYLSDQGDPQGVSF